MDTEFDLLVVGGGINGAGIARDAAGRGMKVLLVEQDDLAGHTSSASSKLIHGGIRYLEHYEFRLVSEALAERERLLGIAPHLIRPLQFVLPHDSRMRPAWMIRIGIFLYDHLGRRQRLPGSSGVRLPGSPFGAGLKPSFKRGFTYWDCWGDDARLVAMNARDAADHGAEIAVRTRLLSARRDGAVWTAELEDRRDGGRRTVTARAVVNATGGWAGHFLSEALGVGEKGALRLIKGSHIVTRRLYEGDHAYVLQNPDHRIVFVIPYEGRYTLIGTTDIPWGGSPEKVVPDPAEIDYLCKSANRFLATPITPADVVWSYAGLRPLHDDESGDPSAISRDYVLEVDGGGDIAPVLSVFGGKITTYRALAEHALQKLGPLLGNSQPAWTSTRPLPGGGVANGDIGAFIAELARRVPFLPAETAQRWGHAYGTRALNLLGDARSLADLGEDFGAGLTRREVDYLVREEWARTAEDILWRRSKLGLHIPAEGAARLAAYLETNT